MCSTRGARALPRAGSPIRKSPDHRLLPTPRRLSQVAASFFGAWCLGIHLGPLVACPACIHSSVAEARLRHACKRNPVIASAIDKDLESTYSVDKVLVEMTGLEPVTPCLQSRCSPS